MASSINRLAAAFGLGAAVGSASAVHFISGPQVFARDAQTETLASVVHFPGSRFVPISRKEPRWASFSSDVIHQGRITPWNFNWDHRHFEAVDEEGISSSEKKRPAASRHLILVRHGQYNLEGVTDEERYLTPVGESQAARTGQRLADLGLPLSYMVSSTLTRAKQTAELIRPCLPLELPVLPDDPILCEGAPYPPEPGAVKGEDVYHVHGARIESAFRKYFHRADRQQEEDSYELIVCHANVIRYFVCRALQLPPEAWLRMSLKHASMTWVTIRPDGRTSVRAVGEAGHLPPNLLSTTASIGVV